MPSVRVFNLKKKQEAGAKLTPIEQAEIDNEEQQIKAAQPKQEGAAYIKEREKLAAQIMQPGVPAAAQRQAAQQLSQRQQAQINQPTANAMAEQQMQQQKQQGVSLEQRPQKANLMPEQSSYEQNLPFGSSVKVLKDITGVTPLAEATGSLVHGQGFNLKEERYSLREKIGAEIEAIPGLGRLGRMAGAVIGTPSSKVDDIRKSFDDINDDISRELKEISPIDPQLAIDNLNFINERISEKEAQIQRAIIISAELRSNPEEVDGIMEQIRKSRENIFFAKRQIIANRIAQNI